MEYILTCKVEWCSFLTPQYGAPQGQRRKILFRWSNVVPSHIPMQLVAVCNIYVGLRSAKEKDTARRHSGRKHLSASRWQ